jgi:pullulanase
MKILLIILLLLLAFRIEVPMAHAESYVGMKSAWLEDLKTIRVTVAPHIHLNEIKILDHDGEPLTSFEIKRDKDQLYFQFSKNLNFSKNYQVIFRNEKTWAFPSLSLLNTNFVTNEILGARINNNEILLSLWSPTATNINVLFYEKDAKTLITKQSLKRKINGVWVGKWQAEDFKVQSFDGLYYQYEVTAFGQTNLALDPYAKSISAFNPQAEDKVGKAAIVNIKFSPHKLKALKLKSTTATDFVAYEAHIHDFTIDPNLDIEETQKGTYKGFEKIIPHLKDLGITHVQFMPLQSFFTVNENNRVFQDAKVPMNKINYNWGYDPQNYFTPDGWYSLNAKDPYLRIKEVKELFASLHQNGIGVILDVVYNHLYQKNILDSAAPGCYLRKNDQGDISTATGAGVSLETRNLMARRLIIDSLKLWQKYYGVDGFRFDLMGFIDQQTMIEIRKALGPEAVIYGEAWNFTDLPFIEATTKTNFPHQALISVFNDSSRDSYAGQMAGKGFVQGEFNEAARAKTGIIGGLRNFPDPLGGILTGDYHLFANEPFETMNYLAIHDGFTLWDKINLSYGGDQNERERLVRFAFGMLLTSQGRIVIHGGDEIGRSKPLSPNDPNADRAHTSNIVDPENGIKFFHENSYASPDVTNMLDWNRSLEFTKLKDYVKGLIQLRHETPGLRYSRSSSIINGLHFIDKEKNQHKKNPPAPTNEPRTYIAYIIDNTLEDNSTIYSKIIVIHNSDVNELNLIIPEIKNAVKWCVLVDDHQAGVSPIMNSKVQVINGEVRVPRKSTVVLGGRE